jgi:glyoxylase-like metal-dependent hydrolase (beta-lactamase superfamily II)
MFRDTPTVEVRMTRKCLAVVALAMMFVSVAAAQDAKTVIANATKAMGYEGLNTLQYSGPISHEGAGLGQWISPTKGWHHNTVRDYVRFFDYSAGTSQRNGLSKREGDPATGLLPGGGGLDPNQNPAVAGTTNVAANGTFVQKLEITLSPPGFLKMAAAAPNATARNQNVNGKRYTVVTFDSDQKAPSGVPYKISGYINQQNMLEKVETAYEDAAANGYLFGDIQVEQNYADYKDFGGVKFPTRITQNRAGVLFSDATVTDAKANGTAPAAIAPPAGGGGGRGGGGGGGAGSGAPGGGAPGGGGAGRGGDGRGGDGRGGGGGAPGAGPQAAGAAPGAGAPGGGAGGAGGAAAGGAGGGGRGGQGGGAAAPPGPRKIADGVFVVTNGYRTLAIEMKDGIVLLDAPQNGTPASIQQAKEAIPNKPITHVITTHLHMDHVGGLRTVLADGAKEVTLVTHEMNKAVVEKWFSNPRTLQATTPAAGAAAAAPAAPAAPAAGGGGGRGGAAPAPWPDDLAKNGKKVKFQWVKDKWTLKDDTRTIEVYAIKGAIHGEDMMVIYLPKEKVIFEADAYNPGAVGAVTNPTANGGQLAFQKLLASELDRLKIDYTTIVSGHAPAGGGARDATKQDLMVAIGKEPPPAAK